ncbi:unnamed protein product [Notodromas monacha]|uniref:Gamma-butyrobetaine dioxygenase n=1 Tax=Notodromas monacha TaxID=399045 RepID=A0A7R9BRJ6_9CRUS|nr:unnamed protein product [Notodromas monacha]CAG0919307.1 unnamed protein product [Notodromas monacha]
MLDSAVVAPHHAAKIVFNDHSVAEFKFIWLRDSCKCQLCVHEATGQRLLDSNSLDLNIRPKELYINDRGQLEIIWPDASQQEKHRSIFDASWLYRYGQCFMENTYEQQDVERNRPPKELWDREKIKKQFPKLSYTEFQSGDAGLRKWLEYIHIFGIAVIQGVPTQNQEEVREIVNRFAYVKQTAYGLTFDVLAEPKAAHLANTGRYLEHHTDLNYREKAPGLQLLHCLKSEVLGEGDEEAAGGKSFFVDGFHVAQWLEDHEPAAFHILTSTPLRFQIKMDGKRYSQLWPVIALDSHGDLAEIHYNNRTSGPLQAPNNVVIPFYHALKKFVDKLRDPASELVFAMSPGDVVAFDNRRVLHGRTAFNPRRIARHLKGCYVDIDEAYSKYDSLL